MCITNVKLTGKVAVITGGGSGMGLEAAKDLAYRGARVIIASRNATKLRIARDNIQAETGNPDVDFKVLNLESLTSVRRFAHEVRSENRLDILINNAGGVGLPDVLTEDGLTLMMQLNFFGGFLLTYLLLPLLKSSAPSRIINSSAISMYFGKIDFDHWNDIGRNGVLLASGNAKLATALITVEWDQRLKGTGVTANSFDPFFARDTDILAYLNKDMMDASLLLLDLVGRPKKEVGQQIAYYAAAPGLEKVSGAHFKFCTRWPNHWQSGDQELRNRLWEEAKKAVRITPDEDWEADLKKRPLLIPKLSIRF